MANTIIEFDTNGRTGLTLTADVHAPLSDTLLASGKTCTEQTNRKGVYRFTMSENVTGLNIVRIKNGTSTFGALPTDPTLADDTNTYEASDRFADVKQWLGTKPATPATAGRPSVDVISAAGTAWNSGAINSTTIATGAIDADSLAADAIAAIFNYAISLTNGSNIVASLLLRALYEGLIAATGTVNADGSETTTSFKTELTQADDYWNDCLLSFTSHSLIGQTKPISDFANTDGVITLDEAFTSAPQDEANFVIIRTHVHPVSQIQSGLATSSAQTTAQNDLDILTGSDGATLATTQANYAPAKAGDQMALVNDAITAGKYDESTAFPITAANGSQFTEAGGDGDHLTAINLPNQTMDIVGNITGNLSGSVGSVTGAVGSVTGNVGGNVAGSVGSVTTVSDKTGYSLAATGLDSITATTPAGLATNFREKINQIWARFFNKVDRDSGTTTITHYADDGTTPTVTQSYTTSGTDEDETVGGAS